jgi:glycosyltransferase involved in cell wall biosynthesis
MPPAVSVIMTSYNARRTIGGALRSLQQQASDTPFETVLVDSSTDGTADLVEREFPWVRVLRFEQRKFCGDGRNIGIGGSSGPVIAFLDADCEAAPDFIDRVVEAHERHDTPSIGGAVGNANSESSAGWAYWFVEFSSWSPGLPGRDVDDVPGCSMSIKRSGFERFGPFLEGSYCSDSAFHWAMARAGLRPRFEPSIRVAHRNPSDLSHIAAHAASHGGQFGRVRRQQTRPSTARLWAWRLGGPVVPGLLLGRTVRDVWASGSNRLRLLRSLPAVLLVQSAWAWGEWTSYWERADREKGVRPLFSGGGS